MLAKGFCVLVCCSLISTCSGSDSRSNHASKVSECDDVRLLPLGQDRCEFVQRNCPSDSIIPYLRLFYCNVRPAGLPAEIFFQILCVFLLVLIFRLLGSTADNFFSPILTQISQDLGLPPRFAGVTLLALGNGAPDLVSSIAFVKAGQYRVAISGLLGGGMFVGAAVAGTVIMTAGGVKARGALLRDVSSYLVAVGAVALILWHGTFTWGLAALLLAMYLLFVAGVLAADIVHLWQTRRRGSGEGGEKAPEHQQPLLGEGEISHPPQADLSHLQAAPPSSAASLELTESHHTLTAEHAELVERHSVMGHSGTGGSGGRDSSWSVERASLTYQEKVHMSGQTYREMALAEMAQSSTFFGQPGMERARRLALLPESDEEGPSYVPPLAIPPSDVEAPQPSGRSAFANASEAAATERSTVEDRHDRTREWCHSQGDAATAAVCGGERSAGPSGRPSMEPCRGADPWPWIGQRQGKLAKCLRGGAWALQGSAAVLGVLFDAAEFPFTILRRVSIPLVDSDSYSRPWLVAAAAGAPTAMLWYFQALNLHFTLPLALVLGALLAAWCFAATTPERPPEWSLGLPFPVGAAAVAVVGFAASAMWIDTIAGELVSLLEYLGVLSGIPKEVLGLTVLAWGNSVGDLSTNTAMARRGLSNMAMTACFAGPIINLLIALSLGFMRFLSAQHVSSTPVQLMAIDVPAIAVIFVNGILLMAVGMWHGAWVPAWYGVVPLVLYGLYIAVCLAVAFG